MTSNDMGGMGGMGMGGMGGGMGGMGGGMGGMGGGENITEVRHPEARAGAVRAVFLARTACCILGLGPPCACSQLLTSRN